MLVSGDRVRAQFCEEGARASSSDVSINSMNSQRTTIPEEIITVLTRYRPIVLELI